MKLRVQLEEAQEGLFAVYGEVFVAELSVGQTEPAREKVDVKVTTRDASWPRRKRAPILLPEVAIRDGKVHASLTERELGTWRCSEVVFEVEGVASSPVLLIPGRQHTTSVVLLLFSLPFVLLFLYVFGQGAPSSASALQAAESLVPAALTGILAGWLNQFGLPWLGATLRTRYSVPFFAAAIFAVFAPHWLWINVVNDTGRPIALERGTPSGDRASLDPAEWRTFWFFDRDALAAIDAEEGSRPFCFSGSAGLAPRCSRTQSAADLELLSALLPKRARISCRPEHLPLDLLDEECPEADGDRCLVVARGEDCAEVERSGPRVELHLADAVRESAASRCGAKLADVKVRASVRLPDRAAADGGATLEYVCSDALADHSLTWRSEDPDARGPIEIESSLDEKAAVYAPSKVGRIFFERRSGIDIARVTCRTRDDRAAFHAAFAGRVASLRAIERFETRSGFEWAPLPGLEQFGAEIAVGCFDPRAEESGTLRLDADAPIAFEMEFPPQQNRVSLTLDVSADGRESGSVVCKGRIAGTLAVRRVRYERPMDTAASLHVVTTGPSIDAWQSEWVGTAGSIGWECRPDGETPGRVEINGRPVTLSPAPGVLVVAPVPAARCCYQYGASCLDRRPARATLCASTGRRDPRCPENGGMTYTCY